MVSVIAGESRRLSRLIENLLELSRLQAGSATRVGSGARSKSFSARPPESSGPSRASSAWRSTPTFSS